MAIIVKQRPNDICWSGNPITYQLYSYEAEQNPAISFEVDILFKRTDQVTFESVYKFSYAPTKGVATFSINEILQCLLEYELPSISGNEDTVSVMKKATGKFYITFREIIAGVPSAFNNTEQSYERFVVRGGISFEKWRGDNFWKNYFDVRKPFLTWQLSGKLVKKDEKLYLYFLNLSSHNPADIKVRYTVTDIYEFTQYVEKDCTIPFGAIGAIPCCFNDVGLNALAYAKVYTWKVQLVSTGGEAFSEEFIFESDNRPDYNNECLHYRNSLGGLDSVRLRGVISVTAKRSFSQVESGFLNDYFENDFISPRQRAVASQELLIKKGDTGFVRKEEQDRLRDMFHLRECWQYQLKKWLPILLVSEDEKLKDTSEKKWHFPVSYSVANTGNNHYTPESIDLKEGEFSDILVSAAVIDTLTATKEGLGVKLTWVLRSGFADKYRISSPTINGGTPVETTNTQFIFSTVPEGANEFTVTPLTDNNGIFIAGVPRSIIYRRYLPLTLPNPVSLADGQENTYYYSSFEVEGSLPINITDRTLINGLSVMLQNKTIIIHGTPTAAVENAEIMIALANPETNRLIISDTITIAPYSAPPIDPVPPESAYLVVSAEQMYQGSEIVYRFVRSDLYTSTAGYPIDITYRIEDDAGYGNIKTSRIEANTQADCSFCNSHPTNYSGYFNILIESATFEIIT